MKLATEDSGGLAKGLFALSLIFPANKHYLLLKVASVAFVPATGALLFALLLPARLVPLFEDLACWVLAGAVGVLALLVTVKVIEGLLDS